jgi:hypothetical protein
MRGLIAARAVRTNGEAAHRRREPAMSDQVTLEIFSDYV